MANPTPAAHEALKPQYGWSVALLLPAVPAASRLFVRNNVSANMVSWSSLVVFLAGLAIYCVWPNVPLARLSATIFFVLGTFLDIADGHVARMTGTSGKPGAYLDAIIDLIRYNLFFAAIAVVALTSTADYLALIVYVALLNLSFVKLFLSISRGGKNAATNSRLKDILPIAYVNFCYRNRFLFNPTNLEDQLLFFMFVVAITFNIEAAMIWACLVARIIELGVFATRHFRAQI